MPKKCSVPLCRGNYDTGPRVSVFKFPEDIELREKWIASIKRENFKPTVNSRVCELHFESHQVLKESSMYDERTGQQITARLKIPRLLPGAIPKYICNRNDALGTETIARLCPEERRLEKEMRQLRKAIDDSMKEKEEFEKEHCVSSIGDISKHLEKCKLSSTWDVIVKEDVVMILAIELHPDPVVMKSIVVDKSLQISVFVKSVQLNSVGKFFLPYSITNISDLLYIIDEVEKLLSGESDGENYLSILRDVINLAVEKYHDNENLFKFFEQQLVNIGLKKNCFRYSSDILIFSSLLHSISPHAYRFIRCYGQFILPHPDTVSRICSKLTLNPFIEQQPIYFLAYMKSKFKLLKDNDKVVVLMLDEIYIKPYLDYKGGNIVGASQDGKSLARSAHVLMVQSLFSTYKDVVHIFPVDKLKAQDLHNIIKITILGLEDIGLKVVSVITDNNAVNKKAMSYFANPPKVEIVYLHPSGDMRPLFFIIDPVHILKGIRNNWLNQKDDEVTMNFPDFENCSVFKAAKFSILRHLHRLECHELCKFGYGISLKSLYPSNMEKQNVKLVLQVFSDHVVAGLFAIAEKHNLTEYSDLACYIQVIIKWWKIMNVKSCFKGICKSDVFQTPFRASETDEKFCFLLKFSYWLDHWKNQNLKSGTLTNETHMALSHTTHAVIEFSKYCTDELGAQYLLLGKLQTDELESRFGKYRQLAGSQYCVSLRQIFETESKLRLMSTLPLMTHIQSIATSHNDLSIDFFSDDAIQQFSSKVIITIDDIKKKEDLLPVITYIAGFCVHCVNKHMNCGACKSLLTIDKHYDDSVHPQTLIKKLDRGGLCYPQPDVVNIVMFNQIVIEKLVSPEMQKSFLKSPKQKLIAVGVSCNLLQENEYCLQFDSCEFGHLSKKVQNLLLSASTNIFLKNYCTNKNDILKANKKPTKKRKLEVFELSKQK